MKKENLIKAAEDLQSILGLEPPINLELPISELKSEIKKAALWLFAEDVLQEETVNVLKSLNWDESDFTDLVEKQDPIPAFERYEIYTSEKREKKAKVVRSEIKRTDIQPDPDMPPLETEPIEYAETPPQETEPIEYAETPPQETEPTEYTETPPPKKSQELKQVQKTASAYGMALTILGTDPHMGLHNLYDKMKSLGFDLKKKGNTIKTAHSTFRRIYRDLKNSGYAK